MVVGCLICVAAMLLLGFTRPFATIFLPFPSTAVSLSFCPNASVPLNRRVEPSLCLNNAGHGLNVQLEGF